MSNRNTGYDFAQKENWRNRVWNRLAARVKVPPRDATVLYLAAEDDLDFEPARKRGFHSANLIAINNDQGVVDALRAKGRLAICGDAAAVLMSWPESRPIHAMHLDYCGGCTYKRAQDTVLCLYLRQCADAVCCVNMLRGREADWPSFGATLARQPTSLPIPQNHRGRILLMLLLHHVLALISDCQRAAMTADDQAKVIRGVAKHIRHECFSYPSGHLWMDTALFDNPIHRTAVVKAAATDYATPAMRRQISAVLAHQTRRLAA